VPSKKGWLTPNSGSTEFQCRPVLIPLDDNLYFMAAVSGALLELTHVWNWEQYGDMTPEEAAGAMLELYIAYTEQTCEGAACTLPYPYDVILDGPLHPVRLGEDGHWEELIDGVWSTPEGDYEVPPVPEREEATAAERRCAGAENAVAVLQEVYEIATDTFLLDGTDASVYEAVLGGLVAILGPWAGFSMASGIGLAIAGFFAFFELLETITSDLWTGDFTDELKCILYANSIDTGDVVTFDYPGVISGINLLQYGAGLDTNRQLLLGQVLYMLSIIGADGLDAAGSTTEVVSPDCSDCNVWCYYFDFELDDYGWSIRVPPDRGEYQAGVGFVSHYNNEGAIDNIAVYARLLLSSVPITHITVTYDFTEGSPNSRNLLIIEDAVTLVDTAPVSGIGQAVNWDGTATTSEIGIQIVVATSAAPTGGPAIIKSVLLRGTGTNPFGDDNCA